MREGGTGCIRVRTQVSVCLLICLYMSLFICLSTIMWCVSLIPPQSHLAHNRCTHGILLVAVYVTEAFPTCTCIDFFEANNYVTANI